jgi:hypothetical protein
MLLYTDKEIALADEIEQLRSQLKVAEQRAEDLAVLLDSEKMQHDETRGYRQKAERESYALKEINKRLKNNIKQHCSRCSIPLPVTTRPNIYCVGADCILRHTYLLEEKAELPKGADGE